MAFIKLLFLKSYIHSFIHIYIVIDFWLFWILFALWHYYCLTSIDDSTCAYYAKEGEGFDLCVKSIWIYTLGIVMRSRKWILYSTFENRQNWFIISTVRESASLRSQRVREDLKSSVLLSILTSTLWAGGEQLLHNRLRIVKLTLDRIKLWSDQHSPMKTERIIFTSFLEEDLTIAETMRW